MEDIFNSFIVNTLIAHRGLHNKELGIPENSLLAFEKAIEKGYGVEFDVQALDDGTPVVFHDSKLSRMTGKDGYIHNLNKEDLKNYNLLNTSQIIPTLEEALALVNARTPIIIEVKNGFRPGAFEKKVLELLKNYKGQFAIVSFNPYILNWFRNNAPNILRGQNSSFFEDEKLSPFKKLLLKRLKLTYLTSPNFISYESKNLPNRYVKRFKHLPLLAWTVTCQEEYLRVIKYCDNVIFEGFEPKV
ncbi:MAG: glycerophosphodiester phosphodiesterase family protein [Clostridia bacterium]|nr:glycerophosphodiester phosphodiesterase family protein [Clostridia bacterium]